jgi:hypothetical protein
MAYGTWDNIKLEDKIMINYYGKTIGRSAREGGWSLVELTITLFLLTAIALFGLKTTTSAFKLQNWSIEQSMTDAYVGIETAYAQRYVFADIENLGRWGLYPAAVTTNGVIIGGMPSLSVPLTAAKPATVNVIRTYHKYGPDAITGAVSYLLESYVVYQNGQQKYYKVSKVYRSK